MGFIVGIMVDNLYTDLRIPVGQKLVRGYELLGYTDEVREADENYVPEGEIDQSVFVGEAPPAGTINRIL